MAHDFLGCSIGKFPGNSSTSTFILVNINYDSYYANIKFKSKKMMQNLKSPTIFYLNKKYKRITGTNL